MQHASFSIIVTVYNCAEYLENCVNSILRSGVDGNEIILIDDGSEDNTWAICNLLSSSSPLVRCFHTSNNGVAAARSFGIEKATGDYIIFLDGDDAWSSSFQFSELADVVSGCDSDLFVFRHCISRWNAGQKIDTWITMPNRHFADWREEQGPFLAFFKDGLMFSCWNKVFKKEIIQKSGLVFHQQQMEDFRFVLEYLKHVKSVVFSAVDIYLYFKREGVNTLTCCLSERMIEGTGFCHRLFLDCFEEEYTKFIHQIMAPQYIGIVNKCLKTKGDSLSAQVLDSIRNDSLAHCSFKEYVSSSISEAITMWLMRMGWFRLLKRYRGFTKALKHCSIIHEKKGSVHN